MPARNTNLPAIFEQVMQADRFRLRQAWNRLHTKQPSEAELAKWGERAEASAAKLSKRRASTPELKYDPELPITAHREQLIDLLKTRQTIVVCGETGSGKSTQLPKICLEAGLGVGGMIGHTQPRRLAARAVASRLAEELGSKVGELVGFKIRFTDSTSSNTLVKLMTDGVLLAETQSDRYLDQYDALIIDEAHERSLNIDFLLAFMRKISGRRPDLKFIITSATIDPQRFAEHFKDEHGPAPIVEVSGRTYPVETRYRAMDTEAVDFEDQVQPTAIADAVDELMAESSGDILTFLPTERDIRITAKHLRGHFMRLGQERSIDILPLYARLSQAEQNKIFAPHAKRRIVLSTNVAESSLTVPGIHSVIDTGLVRISRYAPRSKVQRLPIEAISQASANQRAGRCGRLGPGTCIRLYSEEDYEKRSKFTTPEIRRSDLASVQLQSLVLRLGNLHELPLLDPPSAESIRDGERTLLELGAIDQDVQLTKIGRQLGTLPCDPRVGRMLIEGAERNCLSEVLIIAAALECQDVRQRPAGQRTQADEAHQQFADPHSDFLSYIRLWDFYENLKSDLGRSRLTKALNQKFLSYQGFREWSETVRQLREILSSAKLRMTKRTLRLAKVDPAVFEKPQLDERGAPHRKQQAAADAKLKLKLKRPEGYEAIHQSLLAGLLSGVAQKGDRHEYKAPRELKVSLWPGSGLFRRQPKWIVAAEIVETSKRFARTLAEVDVEWIEKAAGDLLKHTYSDPHWSRKSGSAMVYRRSTLYGLPIVAGRRTALAPIDAEAARTLLIENGLVAGDWDCREAFYTHNQELLSDLHELAQRTRSRDFILDRFHLGNFYNQHLPQEVHDLPSLRSWLKRNAGTESEKALWMRPEDLLSETVRVADIEEHFPNEVSVGGTAFPLAYHFEPGHAADGIAAVVPQAALRQISEDALGWLVPGMLEEKILHLIRSLPKNLRTCFVPAPDVASKLAGQLAIVPRDRPFSSELCRVMKEHSGETIRSSDFAFEKLPLHLRMLVRVVDDDGALLDEGREITALQQQYVTADSTGVAEALEASEWTNHRVTPQTFDALPSSVIVMRGGVKVAAFPALFDLGDAVEARLTDTQAEAERITRLGLTRLFVLKHYKSVRGHVAHLPGLDGISVKLAHWIGNKDLRTQLQDLMARIALVEDQELVQDSIGFEARNAKAGVQLSIAAQEIALWLPKFAEQAHALRLKMEKSPPSWSGVFSSIEEQLAAFFPPSFLLTVPWRGLAEYPRYLQAILMRLEKLTSGGLAKDQKLQEPILRAWRAYSDRKEQTVAPESATRLENLRWMIEEYRVSVFAQKLGTKQTVSEKRIREFISALELD